MNEGEAGDLQAVGDTFLERGREIAAGLLDGRVDLAAVRPFLAILLVGSGTTEFADAYSGVDLLVLYPDELRERIPASLAAGPGTVVRARVGGSPCKFTLLSYEEARGCVMAHDDASLFALRNARILNDPAGRAAELVDLAWQVPGQAWADKAAARYREFRRRKASLAWALRRGQPLLVMDNLVQLLEHALAACCSLAEQPAAGRKWLFRAALRTPAGQAIRPAVFALLSSLGDTTVLGGSYNLRHNRLYLLASEVQRVIEGALPGRGEDKGGGGG